MEIQLKYNRNSVVMEKKFIPLKNLKVYKLARELSKIAWEIYQDLDWQDRKTMGDQFLTATDSAGANIAEGYSRYHYLDRIKFYYNSRASLSEANDHWIELLKERGKICKESYKKYKKVAKNLGIKLNNFISATYRQKQSNFD
jgi:four helix bundle protein